MLKFALEKLGNYSEKIGRNEVLNDLISILIKNLKLWNNLDMMKRLIFTNMK